MKTARKTALLTFTVGESAPPPARDRDAQRIHDLLGGALADVGVFGNRILVAKFTRLTVGVSGRILAAAQTQTEDKWQGKIGLVLKIGAAAFRDEPGINFYGDEVRVGDWVMFHYGDGWDIDVQGPAEKVPCKVIKDVSIHGRVARPDNIF